ncbi:MAG: MauE/DoxX family redox-associated membrane protein, partial [Planctomycetota bacterium]
FQPWAYQFVLFAVIMANCRASVATQVLRWIVVSIYVYSAISKFDYQFLHSLGPQFLSTLVGFFGVVSANWPTALQAWLAMLFPIGELLVGIGLLVPCTRRLAIFAAIGSHLLLLLILGPWGLSHQPGVLVWNLYFIAQAWMLFVDSKADEKPTANEPRRRRMTESLCFVLTGIVIAFPASEPLGYCDHWPAWELYSPRSSRVQIAIHESAIDRLPPDIQSHMSRPPLTEAGWRHLYIDRWSLDSLSVPIYPEDRFQFGVALALAERYELAMAIRVWQQSASDRWTGQRHEQTFVGSEQVDAARRNFRINIEARRSPP